MTIITYRAGWCFADDMVWEGDLFTGRDYKIAWRKWDGAIIAAAGNAANCEKFLELGIKRKRMPADNGTTGDRACSGIIFRPDGVVEEYEGSHCTKTKNEFYAFGSGQHLAMGALIQGHNAAEAARTACIGMSWAASLHGVNHDGEWEIIDYKDVFYPLHINQAPSGPRQ